MMMPAASGVPSEPAPQRAEHRPVELPCTLSRGSGGPITAETIDLGLTGMRLTTTRPLAVDETVAFDLPVREAHIRGQARVVCQERPDVYALRFNRLTQPMAHCLHGVVTGLAPGG
jgi:hypothetical protein